MKPLSKNTIESMYFEYRKMEALMDLGVGFNLSGLFAFNKTADRYINSLLLIDLFSIVDKAIDVVFMEEKLKLKKGKSKILILIESDKVIKHEYLQWYREWRNDAAHNFLRVESFHLRQASKDIQHQLLEWGIIDHEYDVTPYSNKTGENEFHYGAYIGTIPILLFKNQFRDFDGCIPSRCTYGEDINLSLEDYKKALLQKNQNHGVDLVEF